MRYILPFVLFCLLLQACDNNKKPATGSLPKEKPERDTTYTVYDTVRTLTYKRYTGSIGDKSVVVDLDYTDGSISAYGSKAYFKGETGWHDLNVRRGANKDMLFVDYVDRSRLEEATIDTEAQWTVQVTSDSITGKWSSIDGRQTLAVLLRPDSARSYPLESIGVEGFTRTTMRDRVYSMSSTLSFIAPAAGMSKDDAAFLEKTLLTQLDDEGKWRTLRELMIDLNKKNLASNQPDPATVDSEYDFSHEFESNIYVSCDYNYDGLMSIGITRYEFAGGAHPNHGSTYVAIDVPGKKIWKLADMITADSARISALLDKEARAYLNLNEEDTLSEHLLVSSVPPTDNVVLSAAGITFTYSPYEIAAYVYGDISLFLSFDQLKPYLTEAFKRRMHLE